MHKYLVTLPTGLVWMEQAVVEAYDEYEAVVTAHYDYQIGVSIEREEYEEMGEPSDEYLDAGDYMIYIVGAMIEEVPDSWKVGRIPLDKDAREYATRKVRSNKKKSKKGLIRKRR